MIEKRGGHAHISFLVFGAHAVTLQHGELPVKQQFTEPFNSVTLPVFYKSLELFNSFDTFLPSNSVVCTCEDGGSGFYAS
jgi:hypothetical protein